MGEELEEEKREKASLISASVCAVMLCSLASLDRGAFLGSVVGGGAAGRRLGGLRMFSYKLKKSKIRSPYHSNIDEYRSFYVIHLTREMS